ncbi:MAG: hypothetical protein K2Y18_03565 [Alphaproteobacteria bacterium]|jgi:hypothetical protein|nr:hypothetical protein [Alphaproteobacteria bacterium]
MTSQLLINEPPLQILPTLAQTIGLNEAIVLQQVHYWLNPKLNKNFFENRYWVWNTYDQWKNQFPFWGMNTIRRAVANLEESGLLMSFVTRDFKKIKYYSLDYDKLDQVFFCSETNTLEMTEKQPTHPSAQNGQIDLLKSTDRAAQTGLIDRPNLGRCINIDTEITSSENTLPPLSPPSSNFGVKKSEEEEEEEEEKIKLFQNSNPNTNIPHKKPHEEMLETWNQTVQRKIYSGKEVHLTKKRAELLKALLETIFEGQMDSWRDYCTLIANSRYLAGENARCFKVTLDWALVSDNAYKVLEGAIYDQPQPAKKLTEVLTWEEFSEELARSLPSSKYLLPWLKISINLAKQIGQIKYKDWFLKVSLSELSDSKANLSVEGRFIKDYIQGNFSPEILRAIRSIRPEVSRIDFQVIQPYGGHHS